jgi:hypothetical protein
VLIGVGYSRSGRLATVLKSGSGPNTLVLMAPSAP